VNVFKKIFLYLSAFIPLYVLLIIKIAIQLINKNLHPNLLNTLMLALLCVFVGFGVIGLLLAFESGKKVQIYVVSRKNITENHFLNYFSLFVLFALSFEIEYVAMSVVFLLILVMVGVVYVKNNLFYINPLLNIVGFSFYKVEYSVEGDGKIQTDIFLFYGNLVEKENHTAFVSPCNFNFIKK